MKLNPYKTHSITISCYRTLHPPHSPLTWCGLDSKVSNSLKLLNAKIDNKLTFEKHLCNSISTISQKTGLIRKCYKNLGNNLIWLAFSTFLLFGALHLICI